MEAAGIEPNLLQTLANWRWHAHFSRNGMTPWASSPTQTVRGAFMRFDLTHPQGFIVMTSMKHDRTVRACPRVRAPK